MLLEGKDINISPHKQLVTRLIVAYWVELEGSRCTPMLVPNPETTHVNLAEATEG